MELRVECLLRVVKTRLHGADVEPRDHRDVLDAHVVEVLQDHHFAEVVGELADGRADGFGGHLKIHLVRNVVRFGRGHLWNRAVTGEFRTHGRLADIHPVEIDENRAHPVVERAGGLVIVDLEDHSLESAEHEVLRLMRRLRQAHRHTHQPGTILVHQPTCAGFAILLDLLVKFHSNSENAKTCERFKTI